MSNIPRFGAYAAAFEEAYKSDDWAAVEAFFAEEAVYEVGIEFFGGRIEGRAAIMEYFKTVLDGFDRRFESRELTLLEGPVEEGQTVRIRGSATYRAEGVPDFELVLEEIVRFEDGQIIHLEDRLDDEMLDALRAYLDEHRDRLSFAETS